MQKNVWDFAVGHGNFSVQQPEKVFAFILTDEVRLLI